MIYADYFSSDLLHGVFVSIYTIFFCRGFFVLYIVFFLFCRDDNTFFFKVRASFPYEPISHLRGSLDHDTCLGKGV